MTKPKAVIFDFDGVIVNSERTKFKRLKQLLRPYGLRLGEKDYNLMVGKKTSAFLKERFGGRLASRQIQDIAEARRKDQLKLPTTYFKQVPGAKSFILALQGKGIGLCLATGTERKLVNKALRLLNLERVFDKKITGEEFRSSKPSPEVYRRAVKKLDVPKEDILVIEDSVAGIQAAKSAGLRCVAITTTQGKAHLKTARPDIIVHSFNELKQVIT